MPTARRTESVEPLLLAARDTARYLGVSISQVDKLARQGLLTPIRIEATKRARRFVFREVQALGERWIAAAHQRADARAGAGDVIA